MAGSNELDGVNWPLAFFLYCALRAVLFLWAGSMILKCASLKSLMGRNLAGWDLMLWEIYVLLFPLMMHWPSAFPLAFGFLVGFHVLSMLGMTVLL